MEEFNEKGQPVSDHERAFAKKAENELGTKYWVLYDGAILADPQSVTNKFNARFNFKSCSEQKFRGYLSFLQGGEMRKYREVSRIQ